MSATLHIRLLSDLEIFRDEEVVTGVDKPRLQSLLAYLLLHRDAPQPRSHLAYLFWPDSTEGQARTNLRKQVHYLRQALPDADRFLQSDTQSLFWRADAPFTLDVADFEGALARAGLAEDAGDQVALREALQQAVSVYRDDLLPSSYDEWVLTERERLRDSFIWALERLVRLLDYERDYEAAIQMARRLLRHDPLHEATYRQLMRLYALVGDRPRALRTYHTCVTVLQRELEVEPSAATREAYEQLLHPDSGPSRPAPRLASEAPLVGRKQEWARIQGAWRRAYKRRPHLVLLTGEPGIGKTRVAEALVGWAKQQGIVTASARCYASEGSLVYAPVADWLRTQPLRSVLLSLDAVWLTEVARLLPGLLVERPDIPPPGPLTESWQRQRLYEALTRAVLGHRPRLLVLDDVHWCDEDTLGWLSYLLRRRISARSDGIGPGQTLVVATRRSGEVRADGALAALLADLRRTDQLVQIELGPLSQEETLELAAHVAGRPLDPALAEPLRQGSEGNPFFVVEMVRAGLPQGTQGADEHTRAMAHTRLPLPPKVRMVIQARLDQLSPEARDLVGLAAVVGRVFATDILREASAADEDGLVRALDELRQRRLVREQGVGAYEFGHDSIREVAYEGLSATRRQLYHRRVAEALEALYAFDRDVASGQIAAHYGRGGMPERAMPTD